jgi:hypothetical protein
MEMRGGEAWGQTVIGMGTGVTLGHDDGYREWAWEWTYDGCENMHTVARQGMGMGWVMRMATETEGRQE